MNTPTTNDNTKCKALTQKGNPCKNNAKNGYEFCSKHIFNMNQDLSKIKRIIRSKPFLIISMLVFICMFCMCFSNVIVLKHSFKYLFLIIAFVSFFTSIWFRWNPDRFIPQLTNIFMAIATIFIAFITWLGFNSAERSANTEKQNTEHKIAALQMEYRPYLVFWLKPGGNIKIQNGMFYFVYSNEEKMYLSFNLINKGKIPAQNVELKYDSFWIDSAGRIDTIQPGVLIENPEGVGQLSSDGMGNIVTNFVPEINISKLKNNSAAVALQIILTARYEGESKIDPSVYSSQIIINFEKKEENGNIIFFLKKVKEKYSKETKENLKI